MKRAAALAFSLSLATAHAAPGGADLQAAATQAAQTLGGVLRDCPASFAGIGFPEKQCVGLGESVETARVKLNAALADDLYGVWRSRDGQRSVYNWLKTAGGYVYLRLQPDPEGRAQTLAYLDLPPAQAEGRNGSSPGDGTQIGGVILTPAVPVSAPPEPATPAATTLAAPPPAATGTTATLPAGTPAPAVTAPGPSAAPVPAPASAPMPFGRTLKVQNNRLNGPDVLAVQNRLIALMRPVRAGQGDGWYGPVTAQTVRVFQKANDLPPTGVVDRATWDRLFSATTQGFAAPMTP